MTKYTHGGYTNPPADPYNAYFTQQWITSYHVMRSNMQIFAAGLMHPYTHNNLHTFTLQIT